LAAADLLETFLGKVFWVSEIISGLEQFPTIKPVLLNEAVKFAKPWHVGCQSHVYSFRHTTFLRASLPPTSGNSAS
jgi:hypothetical protein